MKKWLMINALSVAIFAMVTIMPAQATLVANGMSTFDSQVKSAAANTVFVILPDVTSTGKPSGVEGASAIDWQSEGILNVRFNNPQKIIRDTNTNFVNADGSLSTSNIPASSIVMLLGGPGVNSVVHYYESISAMAGGATATYGSDATYAFFKVYGTTVSGSELAFGSISNGAVGSKDNFVVHIFSDAWGRSIYIFYGFGGYGTRAAVVFLAWIVYYWGPIAGGTFASGIGGSTKSYYIGEWIDQSTATNPSANGLADATYSCAVGAACTAGDTYSVISSGP